MKNKAGWFLVAIMVLSLALSGAAWAADADTALAPVKLSLEQAVAKGLENNQQIALAQLSVDAAAVNMSQVTNAAKDYRKTGLSLVTKDGYTLTTMLPAQAELGKNFSLLSQTYTTNYVKFAVEQAYYSLQTAEKNLEVKRLSLGNAKTLYDQTVSKEKLGVGSKVEVMTANSSYLNAQAVYENSRTGVLAARRALNTLLNMPLDTPIIVTDKQTFKKVDVGSEEDALQKALAGELTYNSKVLAEAMAKIAMEYSRSFEGEPTYSFQKANIGYKEAQEETKVAASKLEVSVKNAFEELNLAEMNYNTYSASRDLAKEAFRLAKLRYDNGLATLYDVQSAEEQYLTAELGVLNAIDAYNAAKNSIYYNIY